MSVEIFRFRSADVRSASEVLLHFSERQPSDESLAAFLACDTHYFLAASDGEVWAGFAYAYELSRPDGRSMLFLYSIDVDPAYRRRGIGTAMLSYLLDVVEQRQMKELFVLADVSNEAAISFYRATGGVPEGRQGYCFVYYPRKITNAA